jgi:hypothetical protein
MTAETGSLTVDELAELRKAAKALFDSRVLTPHEKQHTWVVLMRLDGQIREAAGPESPA